MRPGREGILRGVLSHSEGALLSTNGVGGRDTVKTVSVWALQASNPVISLAYQKPFQHRRMTQNHTRSVTASETPSNGCSQISSRIKRRNCVESPTQVPVG